MKKVTLTDLNGKEIEVYFADDKTAKSAVHSDKYDVKIEDVPTDQNWFEMTGGGLDEDEKKAHEGGWKKHMDVSENAYEKLNKIFQTKGKYLQESESQIKIDDTIPSDFVELPELRNGAIYKVAGLNLVAKLVNKQFDDYSALLKMKRHGTVFYVEEGSLIRASELEVETYLEESK
jgi:hypothetical protein